MTKACAVPVLLGLLIVVLVSQGQDYLDGGYVGRGNYGDVGQYFTDPIFYSPDSGHYVSPDPAVREMQESLDRPMRSSTAGYVTVGSKIGKTSKTSKAGKAASSIQPAGASGSWHMELSDGKSIDLELLQSGARIFGRGSVRSGISVQWATASGDITGSMMRLDVMPTSGTELYAISLDISKLRSTGSYTLFGAGAAPKSGTVRARMTASNFIKADY